MVDPPGVSRVLSVMDTLACAREKMCAAVAQLASETVRLDSAWARTLAEPVIARRDHPPFRASAMDGYALRKSDLASGATLKIIGVSAAGRAHATALDTGAALRIFTGAPVPEGADCVIPQEAVELEGERIRASVPKADNIRERGVDFFAGTRLIEPGTRLDGLMLALAAAAGHATVSVVKIPRVALLATGNELVSPGSAVRADQIFESVSYGMMGLIRAWGGLPVRLERQADDVAAIFREARKGLRQNDLLVTIGGASVGDHDLVKAALEPLALEMIVNRVAIKPGKPTWFARTRHGPVVGLPGNPAAALVCAHLLLRALLDRMLGRASASWLRNTRARALVTLQPNGKLEHYLRGVLKIDADGEFHVRPLEQQDTSVLSATAQANALIQRPPNAAGVKPGEQVDVIAIDRF